GGRADAGAGGGAGARAGEAERRAAGRGPGPASERPAAEKPAAEKPSSEKAAAKKAGAKRPAPKKSAPVKPDPGDVLVAGPPRPAPEPARRPPLWRRLRTRAAVGAGLAVVAAGTIVGVAERAAAPAEPAVRRP